MNELLDQARPLDDYIETLSERQQQALAVPVTNHGIGEGRLGDPNYPAFQAVPCSMYFYYVRLNSNGKLYVTHHFYPGGDPSDPTNPGPWSPIPRDRQGLTDLVRELAIGARLGTLPIIGNDFQNVEWHRKSYVAVFVDEVNWKLHRLTSGDPSIVFITEPKDGRTGTDNHSFFDAMDLDIEMPIAGTGATDIRSAVVFINHMKVDEAGNDLQLGDTQFYQFKMFFDVAFASGAAGMTVIFDPGGTNEGPPLPPP